MSLGKGVLFATLCGLVGAGLWAGVAYLTGWEFGILAIIVGGAAGFGMAMGCGGRGGRNAGILAAVVAAFAILAGKAGVAHIMAQEWLNSDDNTYTLEDARDHLASEIYDQFEQEGREMTFEDHDEYPGEVMAEAYRQWSAMSPDEQEQYRAGLESEMKADMQQAAPLVTILAFVFSFRPMHLLFFGLALTSAYKTGSHVAKPAEGELAPDAFAQPQAAAPLVGRRARTQAARSPGPPADGDSPYNFFARLGDGADALPVDDGRPTFQQHAEDQQRKSEAA